ncbi:MAG TPA: ABC transporter permease [Blastocatellia bacterium]|nr:ABC transporter permease [Blastocatellia bacterium]
METLIQDTRYAIRTMLQSPGFTAVAVLALALGIGANTAIFSVVNAVLLRPLPYTDPDRLVHVHRMQPPIARAPISRPDYFEWENQQQVFQGIAAFFYRTYNLTGVDQAERLNAARVTGGFFSLFGINPAAGRFIDNDDDKAGGARVAVISHGLWQRRFGGAPDLIGKTIALNADTYTVIGVAPADFQFPRGVEVWTPAFLAEEKTQRGSNYLKVIARLKDGVTQPRASAQMNQIAAALAEKYPANDTNLTVAIAPLLEEQVGRIRPVLLVLLGAVGFVLLIACANVANLLLARAAARQKEFAIRTALGASRVRLARQLMTESVLLALAGGALGAVLSVWGISVLVSIAPGNIPRVKEVSLDKWVLGFTFLSSLLTGLVFGLAPSLAASRTDLNETLKEGGRGTAATSPHRALVRRVLVVAEIALSLVLLVSAGLLIESIKRLTQVSPGFDPHNLLTANLSFPRNPSAKDEDEAAAGFLAGVEQRIASLPGIISVGTINDLPVTGYSSVNGDLNVEGRPAYKAGEAPVAEFRLVTPGYFRSIGIPLLSGRELTDRDDRSAPQTVLINHALADAIFPGEDPVGKRLLALDDKPHEIVGVVGDARQWGLDRPADPEIYFPLAQVNFASEATLVLRTAGDPSTLAGALRQAVREASADAPVFRVKTMMEVLADSTSQQRFNMSLMTIFAAVALVMAAIGLYGVISYSVTQRTHEIGVRLALGASTGDVLKLVVGQGMLLAGAGVALGLCAAFGLTRLLSTLLFGVSPTDPLTFAVISLILIGVALAACFVPARRATKVDPMVALRYE